MIQIFKNTLIAVFLLINSSVFSQINMADSTVQVITYWEIGDKKSYDITLEKFKIKNSDTISSEIISYDIEITVLKANDHSYTIEWNYQNITSSNQNPIAQKLLNTTKDLKIIFKTDELGGIIEVVNWKEIKNFIQKSLSSLKLEFKNVPEMDKVLKQIEATYSTKEAIESTSIKDIQQFHCFHGAKYKLKEVLTTEIQVHNLYNPLEPFDADITVYLDQIDEEESYYVMRLSQEINIDQLTNATFNYLTEMANNMKVAPPKREDLQNLGNQILGQAIIQNDGWILYSVQKTTATTDDITAIERRVIEIK
jgi:hypothetical protein